VTISSTYVEIVMALNFEENLEWIADVLAGAKTKSMRLCYTAQGVSLGRFSIHRARGLIFPVMNKKMPMGAYGGIQWIT
jgi:hypothetical protein